MKRFLSIFLCVVMLAVLMPVMPIPEAAAAATVPGVSIHTDGPTVIDVSEATGYFLIKTDGLYVGTYQWSTADGDDYTINPQPVGETGINPHGYELTGTTANKVGIKVDPNQGISTTIILNNVNMSGACRLVDVSHANVTLMLKGTNNSLTPNGTTGTGAICKDGIDDYQLIAKAAPGYADADAYIYCEAQEHSIVFGSQYASGPSNNDVGFSNVTIESGSYKLVAQSHTPALGANCYIGHRSNCYTTNLRITGGIIEAHGGSSCAAIGTGYTSPIKTTKNNTGLYIGGTAQVTAYGGSNSPAIGVGAGVNNATYGAIESLVIDVSEGAVVTAFGGDPRNNVPAIGSAATAADLSNVKVTNDDKDVHAFIIYGANENEFQFNESTTGIKKAEYGLGDLLITEKGAGKNVYYANVFGGPAKDVRTISTDRNLVLSVNNIITKTGGAPFTQDDVLELMAPDYMVTGKNGELFPISTFSDEAAATLAAVNAAKANNEVGEFEIPYHVGPMEITVGTKTVTVEGTVIGKIFLLENEGKDPTPDSALSVADNDTRMPTGTTYTGGQVMKAVRLACTNSEGTIVAGEGDVAPGYTVTVSDTTATDGKTITINETKLEALNTAAAAGELGAFPMTFSYTDDKTGREVSVDSTITLTTPVTYKYEAAPSAAAGFDNDWNNANTALTNALNGATPQITAPTDLDEDGNPNQYAINDVVTLPAVTTNMLDAEADGHHWVFGGWYIGDTKLGSTFQLNETLPPLITTTKNREPIVGRWLYTADKLHVRYTGEKVTMWESEELTIPTDGTSVPTPPYPYGTPRWPGHIFLGWSPALAENVDYSQVNEVSEDGTSYIVYTAQWQLGQKPIPPNVTGSTAWTVTADYVEGQEYAIVEKGAAYSPDSLVWVKNSSNPTRTDKVIFDKLSPNKEYTVLTRICAPGDGSGPSATAEADKRTVKYNANELASMFNAGAVTDDKTSDKPYDLAKGAEAQVIVNHDGNYVLQILQDIHRTIELPTDVGTLNLDLNGKIIKGNNGTKESPPGKPGVKFIAPEEDTTRGEGPLTELVVYDDSEEEPYGKIIGGNGYTETDPGKPGGDGGPGITSEVNPDPEPDPDPDPDPNPEPPKPPKDSLPKVTVEGPATVQGGNGGGGGDAPDPDPTVDTPKPGGDGGDGGPGIDGPISVDIGGGGTVIGGEPGGPGEDGKPGEPGKPTDIPYPPETPPTSGDQFQLRFVSNGGSYIPSITSAVPKTIAVNAYIPYKKDALFLGWYLDAALTQPVTSVYLKQDITVYAKWSEGSDLNSEDHFAYIVGYTDGTVRPENGISRAETATVFYRLLTSERRDEIFTAENSFKDVAKGNWYNKAVSSMARGGYIIGYSDDSFRGNKWITRAEFAAILVRFLGMDETAQATYTDVSTSHWAYHHIATAQKNGYMIGYNDKFRPNDYISRAEVMTTLNRILSRGIDAESETGGARQWPDNPEGAWYYYEVIEATNDHDHAGVRPSEDWPSLEIDYDYDIKYYEWP